MMFIFQKNADVRGWGSENSENRQKFADVLYGWPPTVGKCGNCLLCDEYDGLGIMNIL